MKMNKNWMSIAVVTGLIALAGCTKGNSPSESTTTTTGDAATTTTTEATAPVASPTPAESPAAAQ